MEVVRGLLGGYLEVTWRLFGGCLELIRSFLGFCLGLGCWLFGGCLGEKFCVCLHVHVCVHVLTLLVQSIVSVIALCRDCVQNACRV